MVILSFFVGFYVNCKYYDKQVLRVDGIGYYYYLPYISIKDTMSIDKMGCDYVVLDDGSAMNKYPVGVAICQSPFYFTIFCLDKLFGRSIYGWEFEFQLGVLLSGAFYLGLGLILSYKTWIEYFPQKAVLISIFLITLGTRLLSYASVDVCLSHVYSFALFAALIYLALKFEKEPLSAARVLLCGLISGILIDIRNTSIVMLLMLAIYVVKNLIIDGTENPGKK